MTIIKPLSLRPGDTIGLIAPSSATLDEGRIELAGKRLTRMGFRVAFGEHARTRHAHLGGRDEQRAADVNAMFARDDVRAIFALRGGDGGPRLLPLLDYDLIRTHPKIFVGYSDITAFHLAILRRAGLVTFHGPHPGEQYVAEYNHNYLWRALAPLPVGDVADPPDSSEFSRDYPPPRLVIRPGTASAPLVGGNLTLVQQTLGTPYEIETQGRLLFLEDTGEEPYSIDRMLTHLLNAGKLQAASGVIFGESTDCGIEKTFVSNFSLEAVLRDRLSDLSVPVVYGMRFGHGKYQFTLPLGVHATLLADDDGVRFSIDEAATQ